MCSLTRREALSASALLVAACTRKQQVKSAPVSITQADDYDQRLYDTVLRIFAEHKLQLRRRSIVLKPNLVEFESGTPVNTHPMVVHAVFEACKAMGASSVRIAEGPGHRRCTLDLADAAGYFGIIPGFDDLFTDLNVDEVTSVRLKKPFSKLRSLYLPDTALAADLIISLPKMKTHHWVGATLSMKNFFGLVPGGVYGCPKNVLHWAGIDECIADLYATFPRHFALVDGIEAMEGNGPIEGTSKRVGVLIAGSDLVAVDATCCRIMGLNPERVRYLQLSGLHGQTIEANVPQIGVSIRAAQTDFRIVPHLQLLRMLRG
jgi:uncharacterized protein (DUF362 family)